MSFSYQSPIGLSSTFYQLRSVSSALSAFFKGGVKKRRHLAKKKAGGKRRGERKEGREIGCGLDHIALFFYMHS